MKMPKPLSGFLRPPAALFVIVCLSANLLLTACQSGEPPLELSTLPTLTASAQVAALKPASFPINLYWVEAEGNRGLEVRNPNGNIPPDPLRIVISYNIVPLSSSTAITDEEQQRLEASEEQLSMQPEVSTTWEVGEAQLGEMQDGTEPMVFMTTLLGPEQFANYALVYQMMTSLTRDFDAVTLSTRGKIIVTENGVYQLD
jgi:hypothetical protein